MYVITGIRISAILARQPMSPGNIIASMPPSTKPAGQPACRRLSQVVLSWRNSRAISGLMPASTAPLPSDSTKRAPVQRPVAVGLQDEDETDEMAGRGEPQRGLEADAVDDQREQHDADGERPQADARELALLRLADNPNSMPHASIENARRMKQKDVATSAAKHTANIFLASADTGTAPVIVASVLIDLNPLKIIS